MTADLSQARSAKIYFWKRWPVRILTGVIIALLLAVWAAYFFPQKVLTVDSGVVKVDAMVVLGGGSLERPERAAELFKAGEAPLIICSGIGDAEGNEVCLTNAGVPAADIRLEPKSHTTRENAKFSITMLHALGAHRVIIVTTWYHSRRALATFEHYAPDLQFYSRPSYFGYPGVAGSSERGAKNEESKAIPASNSRLQASSLAQRAELEYEQKVARSYANAEYVKLLGYWVCYGVCPL